MSGLSWILPAGLAAGALLVASPSLLARFRMARRVAGALREWQRADEISPEQLAAFDARVGVFTDASVIDERTWDDLHLGDVFGRLDHCASQPGRQVLYHRLRHPTLTAESLPAFDATVRALQHDATVRRAVHDALAPLRSRAAAQLQAAWWGVVPERPRLWWVFPALTALSLVLLVVVAVWPPAILAWLAVCCLNVVGQAMYRAQVREFIPALSAMREFVGAAERLGRLQVPGLERECETLRTNAPRLRALKSTTRWLRFDALAGNGMTGSAYEWGNMLFALDLTAFVLAATRLRNERASGQAVFLAVGQIDAVCSIATWRESLTSWAVPTFTARGKALQGVEVRHPLLDDGVANSLSLHDTGLLVTGSNMSGKTTFLRALGVNAVLARAIGTVCAREWRAPLLSVRTSMGQGDNLLEGKSFYLAEVERVKALLALPGDNTQWLLLLDELFRGTNTPERVAAGYATMAWLNRGDDIVCVATHDLELRDLLGDAFAAYHFREQVTDGALTFDYRIRAGLSSSRNAIALLRVTGFPAAVVEAALAALPPAAAADATEA